MSESAEFSRHLAAAFAPCSALSSSQLGELERHWALLERWNRKLNLTSVVEVEEAVVRHYCESLFLGLHLPSEPVSVLDVGSGAGFPGIPVAILRPDCRVTLAESHQRKAVFLREATRHLENVRVTPVRAETLGGAFDWVASRAVKWPDVLRAAATSRSVALLLGRDDASAVVQTAEFLWQPAISLPWGQRRVLLIGHRRST
jgi:16S rRNA (guanine527-N7)-methyltransferase